VSRYGNGAPGEPRDIVKVADTPGPAAHLFVETDVWSTTFTIFEGTSEIQWMIIGRAVTELDVR
jgi:hypothetical protein